MLISIGRCAICTVFAAGPISSPLLAVLRMSLHSLRLLRGARRRSLDSVTGTYISQLPDVPDAYDVNTDDDSVYKTVSPMRSRSSGLYRLRVKYACSRTRGHLSSGKPPTKFSKCMAPTVSVGRKGLTGASFFSTGKDELLETAMALHDAAMKDEYFIKRRLAPNVDFWCVG